MLIKHYVILFHLDIMERLKAATYIEKKSS